MKFLLSVLLFFSSAPSFRQDDVSPEVRRFANIVDWSMQTGMAEKKLVEVIRKRSQEFEMSDARRDKMLADVPAMLVEFKLEKAKEWAQAGPSEQSNSESNLLRILSVVIEGSNTFRDFLDRHVGKAVAKDWRAKSAKVNAQLIRQQETEKLRRKIAREYTTAATIAIRYRANTVRTLRSLKARRGQGDNEAFERYAQSIERGVRDTMETSRKAFKLSLDNSIVELDRLFALTAKQKRRLEVAAKGLITRNHRKAERHLVEMLDPDTADADFDQALKAFESAISAEEIASSTVFWKKTVDRTLSDVQKKKLNPEPEKKP